MVLSHAPEVISLKLTRSQVRLDKKSRPRIGFPDPNVITQEAGLGRRRNWRIGFRALAAGLPTRGRTARFRRGRLRRRRFYRRGRYRGGIRGLGARARFARFLLPGKRSRRRHAQPATSWRLSIRACSRRAGRRSAARCRLEQLLHQNRAMVGVAVVVLLRLHLRRPRHRDRARADRPASACSVFLRASVISLSTNGLTALAFSSVVMIRSWRIRAIVKLR